MNISLICMHDQTIAQSDEDGNIDGIEVVACIQGSNLGAYARPACLAYMSSYGYIARKCSPINNTIADHHHE